MPAARDPRRVLIVMPNWLGDVVLASPALAALRQGLPQTHITCLLRSPLHELLDGCGWHDEHLAWPAGRGLARELRAFELVRRLRRQRFDAAILLTNSFRSAWTVWCARIPRRVGFARDGRGWLLTDRLRPRRQAGVFVPYPVTRSYAELVAALGCETADLRLRLGVSDAQEQAGRRLLEHYRLSPKSYAVFSVGAAFGAAKCWLAERFAAVCEHVRDVFRLAPVLVGAPSERPLMRRIAELARGGAVCCDAPFTTLGTLKVVIREARLLVCNDSGPRHIAGALAVPTVTVFGPTHPEWTATDNPHEVRLQARVPCGPCQLRVCPLDHRCMREVTVEQVTDAATRLLAGSAAG